MKQNKISDIVCCYFENFRYLKKIKNNILFITNMIK